MLAVLKRSIKRSGQFVTESKLVTVSNETVSNDEYPSAM